MKKIILILLTLTSIAFAQEIKEDIKMVDEYFLTLEKYQDVMEFSESVNDEQLLDIAKQIYTVYQNFPKITYERRWSSRKNINGIDYGGIQSLIIRGIAKRFGNVYNNILRYPYTFKIKVLERKIVEYFWTYKSYKTVITAQIEYILCGENFEMGDIIEFHCYKDKIYDFEINKSYIVPLEYSYTKDRKLNGLFLAQKGIECVDGYVLDKDLKLTNKAKINFEDLKTLYHNAINLLRENSK